MKCTIAGKMKFEFTNEQGNLVRGSSVFLGEPMINENGEGLVVNKVWIPNSVCPYENIKVGSCEAEFNSSGKVIKLSF